LRKLEKEIKAEILLALSREPTIRLFNQPQGIAFVGTVVEKSQHLVTIADWRIVSFGLAPGSSDLIGWVETEITEEMIGQVVARFAAIEVKQKLGRVTEAQANFLNVVKKAGGIAGVARSTEEAWGIIG